MRDFTFEDDGVAKARSDDEIFSRPRLSRRFSGPPPTRRASDDLMKKARPKPKRRASFGTLSVTKESLRRLSFSSSKSPDDEEFDVNSVLWDDDDDGHQEDSKGGQEELAPEEAELASFFNKCAESDF